MDISEPAEQPGNTHHVIQESFVAPHFSGLREILTNISLFFDAAHEHDPLPILQELSCELLQTNSVQIMIPTGSAHAEHDNPYRLTQFIMINGRRVGRLDAHRTFPFTTDDRALAFLISQLISTVLEQTALHSQLEQYHQQSRATLDTLEQLLEFMQGIVTTTTNWRQVAISLTMHVPRIVGGQRASLLIIPAHQPDTPALVLSNGTIVSPERAREVRDSGLAGLVLRECRPLIIDETQTDQRWLSMGLANYESPSRCAMAVPLIWGRHILGVLTVTTSNSRLFDTSHLNLLELIGHNISLVLHNLTLEDQLHQVLNLFTTEQDMLRSPLHAAHHYLQMYSTAQAEQESIPITVKDMQLIRTALEHVVMLEQQLRSAHQQLYALQMKPDMVR